MGSHPCNWGSNPHGDAIFYGHPVQDGLFVLKMGLLQNLTWDFATALSGCIGIDERFFSGENGIAWRNCAAEDGDVIQSAVEVFSYEGRAIPVGPLRLDSAGTIRKVIEVEFQFLFVKGDSDTGPLADGNGAGTFQDGGGSLSSIVAFDTEPSVGKQPDIAGG